MGAVFRRELASYFKNPIGYFIVGVYGLLSGILFVTNVIGQSLSYMGVYFNSQWFYFINLVVVVLFSFKFFSEEKKNKTDQLLFTSPIRVTSVVLGKFFSAASIFTGITLINILYAIVIGVFGQLLLGDFFVQMLGTLLIGFAMISVALFLSSCTESQIGTVAATFAVLFSMFVIDQIIQFLPNWLSAILGSLCLYSKFGDFAIGVLSLFPIIYYASVTCVFLFLTVRMLERRRWA